MTTAPAFTLVELSVTVGVLIILLGLALNLANRVRADATDQLARQRLRLLTTLMDRYLAGSGGAFPPVPPLVPDGATRAAEAAALAAARANNAAVVRCLLPPTLDADTRAAVAALFDRPRSDGPRSDGSRSDGSRSDGPPRTGPVRLPTELDDPWGTPIAFLPRQSPLIGMARDDRPFFVSAGPDRQFLTRQDNRYSYEEATAGR